jgi:GMP synthase (glutamine-hydrolysing)
MGSIDDIKVLLIQARSKPDMEVQEQHCVLERTGLQASQLHSRNVVREMPHRDWLAGADAVVIGGAGAYSIVDEHPWKGALLDLVVEMRDRSIPLFGTCWGHQVIAVALGGVVENDSERAELGTFTLELTEAGVADELFSAIPVQFDAQMGHHDRVIRLPSATVELARSATQPFEAFRLEGLPIYGSQFHSELSKQRLFERLHSYRRNYPELQGDQQFEGILDSLRETPEIDALLRRFLERFASKQRV